jgi:hypothetical protein
LSRDSENITFSEETPHPACSNLAALISRPLPFRFSHQPESNTFYVPLFHIRIGILIAPTDLFKLDPLSGPLLL